MTLHIAFSALLETRFVTPTNSDLMEKCQKRAKFRENSLSKSRILPKFKKEKTEFSSVRRRLKMGGGGVEKTMIGAYKIYIIKHAEKMV